MIINSQFQAPWWLKNPHLQTLFAGVARSIDAPELRQERWQTRDDDFLDLHWFGPSNGPFVIIFHGLEGSSDSNYVRGLMHTLINKNIGGAVMHFRGCSGEPNRKVQSYHCGHTHDIAWVLNTLAQKLTSQPIFAVGFSIGGAALLNTLAQENLPESLALSLAVSPPLQPRSGANRMNRGFSKIYQHKLVAHCVQSARAKQDAGVKLPIDQKILNSVKTFWEFDHEVTAPLHGYKGADDYYDRAAPRQRLKQITRHCHIIHALDDPFFEPAMIPKSEELGPNTSFELSQRGGHVGFVSGQPWHPEYWLEQRLAKLITGAL